MVIEANANYGTYGFRFSGSPQLAMCSLFAVGHERVHSSSYFWDGLTRTDGPLLLFQYTVEGEGVLESEQQTEQIGSGRAFLVEIPGDHRYFYASDTEPWEFYFLLIRPDLILPNWMEAKKRIGSTPLLPFGSSPIRLLRDIFMEAKAGRISDPYLASSYVYQFISELCRYSSSNQRNRESWPEKIKLAVIYIENHYASMISLDMLAEDLHISKYHFLRTFAAVVGMTPNDYLNRIRTERAMELLRQTDDSIEQIAQQIGYSSGSYFIKVFRRLTKLTPGAFRSGHESLLYNRLFFN
ncbi:AraC family transcriptional regulator [Paenibacillus sp. V4I7]|uniref:AraC family transcriptional regulator n=1 Tax=Paenibacillus sp. V4I7 TaxID=3042307 RepID=UPI002788CDCD|nr:AraC family transcriptional regulator [Paenibacillus sp. V4I7]MDQ0900980.1 AraC-like DNA-binding protein [Paenibacillus sp. V4I7]